jgi:hypothetical protein
MDGHEHKDVVEYCKKVFLPKMKEFEGRMARYEGPDLKRVDPNLLPGERELIAEFQDETCCQANDHKTSAWYANKLPLLLSFSLLDLILIFFILGYSKVNKFYRRKAVDDWFMFRTGLRR